MKLVSSKPFQIVMSGGQIAQSSNKGIQWPKQDLIKYAVFVVFHLKLQDSTQELDFDSWSFFRRLSIFVQSKNPNQCRIHHRKMMKHHPSINSLASYLRLSIHKFEDWYSHYQGALTNLRSCLARQKKEIQKEHTHPQKFTFNIKEEEKECLDEFNKKDEDNYPTGVSYKDEAEGNNKSSILFNQSSRPSFHLSDELYDGGDDFSFLSKRPAQPRKSFLDNGDKWKDCHSSLVNYLEKLNSAMNSSLYDY